MTNAVAIAQQGSNNTTFRNRIINGAFNVSQYNGSTYVTPSSSTYVVDRFACEVSQSSKVSVQQNAGSVTPPAGFSNYLGATTVSAYTPATGENFFLRQKLKDITLLI